HWGLDALGRLDGMFAFAAFDSLTGDTYLVRDPIGEKPLYYVTLPSGAIAFASELHALQLLPGFDPVLDRSSVARLLSFQYIGAPETIYQNVAKLRPGTWLRINREGATEIRKYFDVLPRPSQRDTNFADSVDELEELLRNSCQRRLRCDVP